MLELIIVIPVIFMFTLAIVTAWMAMGLFIFVAYLEIKKRMKTREELPSFDKDRLTKKNQKTMHDYYDPKEVEDDGFITVHPKQH